VTLELLSYFATNGLNITSNPNYDFAGIVKNAGCIRTLSLSTVIIYFLISISYGKGFSIVISLVVAYLTKDIS
jgi:hypothetical protein